MLKDQRKTTVPTSFRNGAMGHVINTTGWPEVGDGFLSAPAGLPRIREGVLIHKTARVSISAILEGQVSIHSNCRIHAKTRIGFNSVVENDASVGERVTVGREASIEKYAQIAPFVEIGTGCTIGEHSRIYRCSYIGNHSMLEKDVCIASASRIGDFCKVGSHVRIGEEVKIGDNARIKTNAQIPDGTSIGSDAIIPPCEDVIDLGFVDGYRRLLYMANGVAYISAGCRNFPLETAIHWWKNRPDRDDTNCQMLMAMHLAEVRGWELSTPVGKIQGKQQRD